MGLTPFVQHAGFGIMAHARAAHFVDRRAAGAGAVHAEQHLSARRRQHGGRLALGIGQRGHFCRSMGKMDFHCGTPIGSSCFDSVRRLDARGMLSAKATSTIRHSPGLRNSRLRSAPIPACLPRVQPDCSAPP
jgi:hypothetical protein